MNRIDEIENKLHECHQKIVQAQLEMKQLLPQLVDAYLEDKGLERGKSVVSYQGDKYLVEGVYCNETGVALNGSWLTGYKIKKDGTPGSQIKTIYSGWTLTD